MFLFFSVSKMVLLDLSGLNPNLTALNQMSFGLSLSSTEEERLQTLNTQWVKVFSQATEQHRQVKLLFFSPNIYTLKLAVTKLSGEC